MKTEHNSKIIETLMDSLKHGVVFVDNDGKISMCNRIAKLYTGIIFNARANHDAGKINEGDIVIIADNNLGYDDGNLDKNDLSMINLNDENIHDGCMLVAVGVYKNDKIEPVYKFVNERQMNVPLTLDVNYYGFHIISSIDKEKKETLIKVNDQSYPLKYFSSVGNMVIIDGTTGNVKFFQAKGYSVRREDAGYILRGEEYQAKTTKDLDVDVTGVNILDIFDESPLTKVLFSVLRGTGEGVSKQLYEINKRPFICSIIPWKEDENTATAAFLIIQSAEHLEDLIQDRNEIIRQMELSNDVDDDIEKMYPDDAFGTFAGKSDKMREVKFMAYKASQNKFNVILTGESGTGKSKLAKEIHKMGNPNAPYVEVNCNAIAPSLLESELFGYVGGAFTGAKSEGKIGFFEAANKGTILLDEIGEIPMDIQVKLLHVLQNKVIYKVGSSKPVKVDVRVIAATNKNLEEEVAAGRFRQDLYYRINVFPIYVPPLRERKLDIYLLSNQILQKVCDEFGMQQKQFSGEALQRLVSYNWPGNVREMENVIERAVTLCESNIIYSEHLRLGDGDIPNTLKEMLAKEEERIIEITLMKNNGDKVKTMEELDVSRSVFYEKLKKYNIK